MNTEHDTNEYEPKQLALAAYLECDPGDLTLEKWDHYDLEVYSFGSHEYAIGDDNEADEAWNQALENYLQECIYPELTGNLASYFDDEKWKRDARMDGRGHSLSPYDGNEEEQEYGNDTFYIYRIN